MDYEETKELSNLLAKGASLIVDASDENVSFSDLIYLAIAASESPFHVRLTLGNMKGRYEYFEQIAEAGEGRIIFEMTGK